MTLEEMKATPVGGVIAQLGPEGVNLAIRRHDRMSGGKQTDVWHVTGDEQDWSSQDLVISWGDNWNPY